MITMQPITNPAGVVTRDRTALRSSTTAAPLSTTGSNAANRSASGVGAAKRPAESDIHKLRLSQQSFSSGASTAGPVSPTYRRVIVVDEFARRLGLSFNPGDKVPDLAHGEVIRAILNAGINRGVKPGTARYVPIDAVQLKESKGDPEGIAAALRSIVATAPRDAAGKPSLKGVAVNLSLSIRLPGGLPESHRRAVTELLAAGADLYVSESNANQGLPNQLLDVKVLPGGGNLIAVGGSDSKIGRPHPSTQPSKINDWSALPGEASHLRGMLVVPSDLEFTPVLGEDGRVRGYSLYGDRTVDVGAKGGAPTDTLAAPLAGRPLDRSVIGRDALFAFEDQMVDKLNEKLEALALKAGGEKKVAWGDYEDAIDAVRDSQAPRLARTLVSVADLRELAKNASKDLPSLMLGRFDIDQHLPSGVDPNKLYVNASALLKNGFSDRYRDDLVFFEKDTQGKAIKLSDAKATGANTPPANSWATPEAIVQVQIGKIDLESDPD